MDLNKLQEISSSDNTSPIDLDNLINPDPVIVQDVLKYYCNCKTLLVHLTIYRAMNTLSTESIQAALDALDSLIDEVSNANDETICEINRLLAASIITLQNLEDIPTSDIDCTRITLLQALVNMNPIRSIGPRNFIRVPEESKKQMGNASPGNPERFLKSLKISTEIILQLYDYFYLR